MNFNILKNKNISLDKKAKSLSFVVKKLPFLINKKNIKEMMTISNLNNKCNLRICLHKNSKALAHNMIILARGKNVYPPHKHKNKGECYHVIKGKLKVIIFSDNGKVELKVILTKGDVFRIKENSYHSVIALTNFVIFHESTSGPFLADKDSTFATWIPKEKNALQRYYSKLLSL
jgi:cupin fold WbuC family metalloprotein